MDLLHTSCITSRKANPQHLDTHSAIHDLPLNHVTIYITILRYNSLFYNSMQTAVENINRWRVYPPDRLLLFSFITVTLMKYFHHNAWTRSLSTPCSAPSKTFFRNTQLLVRILITLVAADSSPDNRRLTETGQGGGQHDSNSRELIVTSR